MSSPIAHNDPAGNPCRSLRSIMREDWKAHSRSWSKPGLHALAVHRLGTWLQTRRATVRLALGPLYRMLTVAIRNLYGTQLHDGAIIGSRVLIAHHVGVVVGSRVILGDDVIIRQNVVISGKAGDHDHGQPRIGDRARIGAGAYLVGPITIGDDANIGPGAVVTTDVPAGATAFAPPARVMKSPRGSTDRQS